jgi:thioredoxin-like negative regulator of GroEL
MHSTTLTDENRAQVAAAISGDRWVVACLCAAWCGTCGSYRATFESLAAKHADKVFVWIDIEDHSDLLGDLDVENFPTLLIQHGDLVTFLGTMLPDGGIADRLIQAQTEIPAAEQQRLSTSSEERRQWQRDCNLRTLLAA